MENGKKIIGNPMASTVPQSDWLQEDSKKPDFIKNRPIKYLGAIANLSALDECKTCDIYSYKLIRRYTDDIFFEDSAYLGILIVTKEHNQDMYRIKQTRIQDGYIYNREYDGAIWSAWNNATSLSREVADMLYLTKEEFGYEIGTKADKTTIPTKLSDLEDDTTEFDGIQYAMQAEWSNNANFAGNAGCASGDYEGNIIHTTYATKAELGTIENSPYTTKDFNFLSNHNNELRLPTVESIIFTFEDGEYPENYTSGLVFHSGDTPTALTYSGTGILNWVGTDCSVNDGLSIFQPSINKQYDIIFYYNGTQFIGLVNGYVPATSNSQG